MSLKIDVDTEVLGHLLILPHKTGKPINTVISLLLQQTNPQLDLYKDEAYELVERYRASLAADPASDSLHDLQGGDQARPEDNSQS